MKLPTASRSKNLCFKDISGKRRKYLKKINFKKNPFNFEGIFVVARPRFELGTSGL